MAMGDRIHPSHGKTTESVFVSDEDGQQLAPTTPVDAPQDHAAELSEPHIEPAALKDAPGSQSTLGTVGRPR